MPEADAKRNLEPYSERIAKCLQIGPQIWEELVNLAPAQCKMVSQRSISSLEYDWVADAIEREFENDGPDVQVIRQYRSLRLNIKDVLIAKFNKLDGRGRPHWNKTRVQTAFRLQQSDGAQREAQALLPGFPNPTKVIIGWQLDKLQREITAILVSCPLGNEVVWEFTISGPSEVEVMPQFTTAVGPSETHTRARAVPKTRPADEVDRANQ